MNDGGGGAQASLPAVPLVAPRNAWPRVRLLVRLLARLLVWLLVAAAGVVMLSQATGWSGTPFVAVLQALTPYLIGALAPIALVASRRGRRGLGFTAALIGLSGILLGAPLVVPAAQPRAVDGAQGVRVAAVNLLYSNDRIDRAADVLAGQDPDVIVFSEYTAHFQEALRRHPLAGGYPFRIERDGRQAGGAAVWSRFPLGATATLDTENYSIETVVDGPDGPFTLIGVHPPAPLFDFGAWRRDLTVVTRRARRAAEPTLLIGDFNASYWHPPFRTLLAAGFVDAHVADGAGFSSSWPTDAWHPAFVRLDHALTGRGLVSTGVADFDLPGSDHRGLVVTVAPAR